MYNKLKRFAPFYGFFGFFGFFGFQYFSTHDVGDLFYFSFFAFFAFFLIGKLSKEMRDERFVENSQKAAAKAFYIPMLAVFIIGWSATQPFGTKEFMVIVSAFAWASSMITYAGVFYYYEKH
ncbi:DUF3796 domain-containing protein [Clostridium aminobutyricum]|uniref:DUF3796 domain-containing protein n=1 Tax=Clostridium aminobutyricum TaxID=33953 RepID=A0A939D6A2_CLOAM|nr:DUF3796 domain-containing protein [Clostridium aminobutyricum]MBN7771846.1 DUF3796 domain-containing protein [Clostridium aminobutyricum]